jgi:hypothetical protein
MAASILCTLHERRAAALVNAEHWLSTGRRLKTTPPADLADMENAIAIERALLATCADCKRAYLHLRMSPFEVIGWLMKDAFFVDMSEDGMTEFSPTGGS